MITRRAAHRAAVATLMGAAALGAGGCGGSGGGASTTTAAGVEGCADVPPQEPKQVNLKSPRRPVSRNAKLTAVVKTSCGSFEIALDAKDSPKTVASFVHQANEGVYDDTGFQRVVEGFLVQGGNPSGEVSGDAGYTIAEPPPPSTAYLERVVAMTKTPVEPDGTSGSQFFVVTAVDAALAPRYALLGKVTAGFETVKRIESLADPDLGEGGGEPEVPVAIETVTIER